MDKPMGLSGEMIFAVNKVCVGKTPDPNSGRQTNAFVTLRLERVDRSSQTIDHQLVEGYLELGITTGLGRDASNGRLMPGMPLIIEPEPPFTRERLDDLRALVKYHLNVMHAECAHQPKTKDAEPCPETGYRFGSEWLVEPLPTDILPRLRAIFEDVDPSKIYDSGEES